MCLPTVKAKSITACRPHNGGGGCGVGGACHLSLRGARQLKEKEGEQPFFLHAEGKKACIL